MKRNILMLLFISIMLIGMAGAANYMYEKSSIKGVGYKDTEIIAQTQPGLAGNKLVEKESGSGNVILDKTELEIERDINLENDRGVTTSETFKVDKGAYWVKKDSDGRILEYSKTASPGFTKVRTSDSKVTLDVYDPSAVNEDGCCSDYISFTKEAELEYMPVSYQTGTYDQKWIEKLCVQNYYIGATIAEMYTHAEHLQKNTEVKTRRECSTNEKCGDCTGALEANFNSNVIGVAHIGWLSKDVNVNSKGRHDEYGRSVEDLTGVFSIEKFIQLWGGNCTSVDVQWLPCI